MARSGTVPGQQQLHVGQARQGGHGQRLRLDGHQVAHGQQREAGQAQARAHGVALDGTEQLQVDPVAQRDHLGRVHAHAQHFVAQQRRTR
ncbi:hypothetical protein LP420_19145 [Massilia sp. B-10]|nr:hypothetical protein LP420_19145 [Massilia sp. B-10]